MFLLVQADITCRLGNENKEILPADSEDSDLDDCSW